MYIEDMKTKLENYRNLPKSKLNKALDGKITVIPSEKVFKIAMYKLGINQRKRQHVRLVKDKTHFKSSRFKKNNTIKLSKENIVFEDFIDERKYKIEKGKEVDVYTRKIKVNTGGNTTRTVLEIAYLMDGEILVINEQ